MVIAIDAIESRPRMMSLDVIGEAGAASGVVAAHLTRLHKVHVLSHDVLAQTAPIAALALATHGTLVQGFAWESN